MAYPFDSELGYLDHDVETFWNIGNPLKAAIEDQFKHFDSILDGRAENVNSSANVYQPPMHRNPRSIIRPSIRMNKLFKIVSNIAPQVQAGEQFQTIMSIFDGANALKLLHRFVDKKQAVIKEEYHAGEPQSIMIYAVNPAQHRQFDHELRLQKIFVRLLHLRGLTKYVGAGKVDRTYLYSLYRVYKNARFLLEEEVSRITPNVITDSYEAHENYGDPAANVFAWVEPARYALETALDGMTDIAFQPRQRLASRFFSTPAAGMTEDQLVAANLNDPAVLSKMIAHYEEAMAPRPGDRLAIDLLIKEDKFEKALTVEHVEDRLINKQVSLKDESSFVRTTDMFNSVMESADNRDREIYPDLFIYEILGDIALVNRQRRNFRLIRDWSSRGRPWKELNHFYDSRIPGCEWIQEGLMKMGKRRQGLWETDPSVLGDTYSGPSGYANVEPFLPAIQPFDRGIDEMVKEIEQYIGKTCTLCHKAWAGGNSMDHTVAVLYCDHYFHLKCIFKYWDEPGKILHTCPTCKQAPFMNWQDLEIDPNDPAIAPDFYHNIFGWNQAGQYAGLDDHKERLKYDIPVRPTNLRQIDRTPYGEYWVKENMYVAMLAEQFEVINWTGGGMAARGFAPRDPPRNVNLMRGHVDRETYIDPQERVLRNYSIMGQNWMRLYQGRNRGFIGTGTALLPPLRHFPRNEVAYLRVRRRRRDVKRRAAFEEAGLALGFL